MLLLVAWLLAGGPAQARPTAPPVPRPTLSGCELAAQIASQASGVSVRRRSGTFADERLASPVRGCEVHVSGSFARAARTGAAVELLRDGFAARRWEARSALDADGKAGTAFAFVKDDVACIVRGEWDGGADGEPPIPAEDWYRVTVMCTSPVPGELGQ